MNERFKKFYENTARTIEDYGQAIITIFDPDDKEDMFAYTIGQHGHHLPELLLIGNMPPKLTVMILNTVGDHMRQKGKRLDEGLLDLDWSFPFKIRKAGKEVKDKYTIQVGQFYKTENYDVLQVMICDKNGKYPGDKGCDPVLNVAMP